MTPFGEINSMKNDRDLYVNRRKIITVSPHFFMPQHRGKDGTEQTKRDNLLLDREIKNYGALFGIMERQLQPYKADELRKAILIHNQGQPPTYLKRMLFSYDANWEDPFALTEEFR
jgi:hypothetical protein